MTTKARMSIPITKPYLGEEEAEAVRKVLESGWLIMGDKCAEFEEQVKAVTGTKYAKACSSCTTGLHMSLLALGVNRRDRVLVPAYTFVATANAVEHCGAEPVFVDIDLRTFNLDVGDAKRRLSDRSRRGEIAPVGVMPVHLFGLCANMRRVLALSREWNLVVVEDAACALGSRCPEGHAGSIGGAACFSFHPRKSVTTGEGGMVTTNDPAVARDVHALRDFGFATTNIERHRSGATEMPSVEVLGYNARLTDIQASIGVEQMKKLPTVIAGRQRRAAVYDQELGALDWLQTPTVPKEYTHTYQSYALLVGGRGYPPEESILQWGREDYILQWGAVRDKLMAYLKERGIATRQGTHAVHMLGYYAKKYGLEPMDFPNTYAADRMVITIPLFPQMTELEQEYVVRCIREFTP